ncbi:reverse transcriptase domain-containing protein [Tanacetum coccineum]
MVTSEGIRDNPKKTKEIANMQSPQTLKGMQSLSGKLAALKRLLSRSAEKSLPFFETLKDITKENKDEYRWTKTKVQNKNDIEKWTIFTDGASNRLRMARKMKVQDIDVKVDSKLVASQISRSYLASSTSMIKYLTTMRECIAEFKSFVIQNIPRNLNQKADVLCKLATHAFDHLIKRVLVEVQVERSTDRKEVSVIVEEEEDN